MNTKYIGSLTAKEGFLNEKEICKKFESWKIDNEAKKWLEIMGYIPEKISSIDALHIPVKISKKMWNFDNEVEKWLKAFTGEILPKDILSSEELKSIKDQRRLFFHEMPENVIKRIIDFFSQNKILVINDIIKGRGGLCAEWLLVTKKDGNKDRVEWMLKDINTVCNFFSQGDVKISPRGSLYIGKITMQRKGGTPDPTSLQFKINPLQLFTE